LSSYLLVSVFCTTCFAVQKEKQCCTNYIELRSAFAKRGFLPQCLRNKVEVEVEVEVSDGLD
jgi:hypothetical protein